MGIRNYTLFVFVIIMLNARTLFAQWWTSTENFGWEIMSLEMSGNNVLATGENGLFLSSDNGTLWTHITSGFPNDYCTGVLTVNKDTVFLEIQKPSSSVVNIYRSIDNGFTWTKLNFESDNGLSSLAFIGKNIFAGSFNGGIYVSPDNGASWALRNEGFPRDSSGYLMIPFAMAAQGTKLFAGIGEDYQNCGLFLSVDSGKSWNATGLMDVHIQDLVVCTDEKGDTNIVAISTNHNFDDNEIIGNTFLSKDGGTTWTKIDSGVTETWPISIATISNENGGTNLFVGTWGDGLYLTSDWGENWISAGLPYNDIRSLAAGFTGDGTSMLFAGNSGQWHTHGTGGSVFSSSDNGVHWYGSAINTYINTLAISLDGKGSSNMFAVASNVLMSSTNNGETWAVNGLPKPHFSALAVSPISGGLKGTHIFFGAGRDGVFHSTDNGESWTAADSLGGEYTYVTYLSMAPNLEGDTILFAGTSDNGGFYSTDYGASWFPVPGLSGYDGINSRIIYDQKEYIGTENNGVLLFIDNDSSWQEINTGLTNLHINTFIICDTILFVGTGSGVFRYSVEDTTWAAAGLTGKDINAFAVKDSSLFAGTSGAGVFLSNDYGMTWVSVNTGLSNLLINACIINDAEIFAGTSQGIWRRTLSEMFTGVEENEIHAPVQFVLSQNYPNPFNPTTFIKYSVPFQQHVTLKVYDLLGKEVETLVNQEKSAGTYTVEFNANRLVSGVYLYRIQVGNFSRTKKMVLLR